jgi:hypothetical protein
MKITIKFLVLGLAMIVGTNSFIMAQQQVPISEARTVATQALNVRYRERVAYTEVNLKKVNERKNRAENTLMYEVIFDDGQGILLSGSKACIPILGYFKSEDGKSIFDNDIPDGLKFLLEEYEEQIELCFQNDTIRLYYQNEWQELQSVTRATPTIIYVGPLLTSRWGQGCNDYNYYSSGSCSGGCKYLAGCVAVAMAQIMYYWKYPVYNPLRINQWDWCNMVDALNTSSSNYINERNAIARLIKDCGDAVEMDYGCSSSGANSTKAEDVFEGFGYHENADFQRKFWHSNSTWKSRMKSDLNQGRPVYYSSIGQHAFVCDGYGSDDMFHFNFGWTGSWDDWFTLDDLIPSNYDFTSRQAAIFYLRPSGNQDYCNFSIPLSTHYQVTYGLSPFINYPPPHENIPKTFTVLESVPAGHGFPTSWHTIESGQTAEYVAHETIILKPGFHAKAGSNFTARIGPCVNCISAKVTVKKSNNGVEVEEELYIAVGDSEEEQLSLGEENKIIADEPQVYPNPTTGLLTIDAKNNNSRIQMIELYNTQGSKQFTFIGNYGCFQEIDISHLPSQVYILKIQMNGQVFTKKLILQK